VVGSFPQGILLAEKITTKNPVIEEEGRGGGAYSNTRGSSIFPKMDGREQKGKRKKIEHNNKGRFFPNNISGLTGGQAR